ncbi:tandem-95 repeat protein [Desulfococcaceae bacterium HSG8]|nr:tandem-95 repeat protein [Desulfococcaceae bacterium HSG8]
MKITITPVNDPPEVTNISKIGEEDTSIRFTAEDFSDAFNDIDGDTISKIQITSLPANGILEINGRAAALNEEISASDLGGLSFKPNDDYNGTDTFEWNGSDETEYAGKAAIVSISVGSVNDAPTVSHVSKAGDEDTTVYFTGSDFSAGFYDPDGDIINKIQIITLPENGILHVNNVPVVYDDKIRAADLGKLMFEPAPDWYGETFFRWKAKDGETWSETLADINIAILPAPVSIKPVSKTGPEDEDILFVAEDMEGFEYGTDSKVRFESLPEHGVLLFDGIPMNEGQELSVMSEFLPGSLVFRPNPDFNGSDSFLWRISKVGAWSEDNWVRFTVTPANDPPTVTNITKTGDEDTIIHFTAEDFSDAFSDIDGDILDRIRITDLPVNGRLILDNSAVTGDDEIEAADLSRLTFNPYENYDGADSFGWNGADGTGYAETAADTDIGDTIRITAVDLPGWLNLGDNGDGTGTLSGTPDNTDVGEHPVELQVEDSAGAASLRSFTITVVNVNDAPVFTSNPHVTAEEDTPYTYIVTTSDPDDDTRVITASMIPAWLTLEDNGDGTADLTGTPSDKDAGEHDIRLQVSDTAETENVQSFTIIVASVNDSPEFPDIIIPPATEDTPYVFEIITADPDAGDNLVITAPELPGWLTLTDNGDGTATLSGTPGDEDVGDHSLILQVEDGEGAADVQSFTISVANVNDSPAFTGEALTEAAEDMIYTYHIIAADPDRGDTLAITAADLPGWLALTDNEDGTAILTGTPADEDVGDHPVNLQVRDEAGAGDIRSFNITVMPANDAPVITGQKPLSTSKDMALTITLNDLTVSDPDNTFPEDFILSIQDGENYTRAGDSELAIIPMPDFAGELRIPATVSDGTDESSPFQLLVTVKSDAIPDGMRKISGAVIHLEEGQDARVHLLSQSTGFSEVTEMTGIGEALVYAFENLPPAADYRAEISSPDYSWQAYNGQDDWEDANFIDTLYSDVSDIDFILIPGESVISGKVIFPADAVAGDTARIHVWSPSTGTEREILTTLETPGNPEISYAVTGLAKATDYIVSVWPDRYKTRYYDGTETGTWDKNDAKQVDTDSSEAATIHFRLEQGGVVSGSFLGEADMSTADLYVEVLGSNGLSKGITVSGDGTFIIEGIEPGPAKVVAWKPGLAPFFFSSEGIARNSELAETITVQEGIPAEVTISVYEGESISGAVYDEDGSPLPGVWVDAWSDSEEGGHGVFTQEDGIYQISGLSETGDYEITAHPDRFFFYTTERVEDVAAGDADVAFYLNVRETYKMEGTIKDENGIYIPNVEVEIWSDSQSFHSWSRNETDELHILKSYRITGLPPADDYILTARPPSDSSFAVFVREDISIRENMIMDIILEPSAEIRGTIQGEDGQIKGIRVIVISEEKNFRGETVTDENGFYELPNVPEASDYVIITASDAYTSQERLVGFGDIDADIILIPESGGEITGQVKNNVTKEPVPGSLVGVWSADMGETLNYSGIAITDAQGRYAVKGLRKEYEDGRLVNDYVVSVNADDYPRYDDTGNAAGDQVNFLLDPGETISGSVSGAESYQDVVVDIFEEYGDFIKSVAIEDDGTFHLKGLSPDKAYQLKFFAFLDDSVALAQWAGEGDVGFHDPDPYGERNPEQAKVYSADSTPVFRFGENRGRSGSLNTLRDNRQDGPESGGILKLRSDTSEVLTNNPEVTVKWESTSESQDERYYYRFNREPDFQMTKRTAPRTLPARSRRATSRKLTGDDIPYSFHVAPVDPRGRIGGTSSLGFRVDTVPPYNVSAVAPLFTLTRDVSMTLGATGAAEMYVSNTNYGREGKWEKWAKSKDWRLNEGEGIRKVYIQFRDRAGNMANALALTEKVLSAPDRPERYQISAVAGENGTIAPSGEVMVNAGDEMAFTIMPEPGYETDQVLVDGQPVMLTGGNTFTFRNLTGNASISAAFKAIPRITHTITAIGGQNGIITPSGKVLVTEWERQGFLITPDPGYEIDIVLLDDLPANPIDGDKLDFINVIEDHTVYATFKKAFAVTHTITASAGNYGSIFPSGSLEADHESDQTFTIIPAAGYQVDAVWVDGEIVTLEDGGSFTFRGVVREHEIHASFRVKEEE